MGRVCMSPVECACIGVCYCMYHSCRMCLYVLEIVSFRRGPRIVQCGFACLIILYIDERKII